MAAEQILSDLFACVLKVLLIKDSQFNLIISNVYSPCFGGQSSDEEIRFSRPKNEIYIDIINHLNKIYLLIEFSSKRLAKLDDRSSFFLYN
jgi:hypothetical protein